MESDQNTSLMFTLSRDAYTDLVMTFSILNEKGEWNTNWPLHPSFPLFLRNVLYTLGNVSDGSSEKLCTAPRNDCTAGRGRSVGSCRAPGRAARRRFQ